MIPCVFYHNRYTSAKYHNNGGILSYGNDQKVIDNSQKTYHQEISGAQIYQPRCLDS